MASTLYTIDLSFPSSKAHNSDVQIIISAIKGWQEKYGNNHVSYIERDITVGKFFGIVTVYVKNILATLPEELMQQVLGVLGENFKKEKHLYEVDILI